MPVGVWIGWSPVVCLASSMVAVSGRMPPASHNDHSMDRVRPCRCLAGVSAQGLENSAVLRTQYRATGEDDARVASSRQDFLGKEKAQATKAAGDQVDALIFECDRRLFRFSRYLLPTQHLTCAVFVSDQRVQAVSRFVLQQPGELL